MQANTTARIMNNLSLKLTLAGNEKEMYKRYSVYAIFNRFNPMTRNNFSRYYNNEVRSPSLAAVLDLCNVLNISIADILPDEIPVNIKEDNNHE